MAHLARREGARRGRDRGAGINSATLFEALSLEVPADAVIAGRRRQQHLFVRALLRMPTAHIDVRLPGIDRICFPAAMGAWAATCQQVDLPWSKGGLGQRRRWFWPYMAEFTTAVQFGMSITHVLLNNGELGKISKEQRAGHWPVWQTALRNPDFAAFAKSCGGLWGIRSTTWMSCMAH